MPKAFLLSFILALSAVSGANAQTKQSAAPTSRAMSYVPGGHTMSFTTEGAKTALLFEPPLPATDGAIYGAMLDAIEAIHPTDRGSYIGPKPFLAPLPSGARAVALDAGSHVYMALPMKADDRRIIGMSFWRVTK